MKKPFALLLLTALLVLLLLTQASALQLPGPLPPIDLPPILLSDTGTLVTYGG